MGFLGEMHNKRLNTARQFPLRSIASRLATTSCTEGNKRHYDWKGRKR